MQALQIVEESWCTIAGAASEDEDFAATTSSKSTSM